MKPKIILFIILITIIILVSINVIRQTTKLPIYIVNIETKDGEKISIHISDDVGNEVKSGLNITYFKISNIFDYYAVNK